MVIIYEPMAPLLVDMEYCVTLHRTPYNSGGEEARMQTECTSDWTQIQTSMYKHTYTHTPTDTQISCDCLGQHSNILLSHYYYVFVLLCPITVFLLQWNTEQAPFVRTTTKIVTCEKCVHFIRTTPPQKNSCMESRNDVVMCVYVALSG